MASKLLKSLPRAKADVARALKGRPPLALCGAGPQPALCNSDRVESSRWIASQRIRFGQLRDYHSYEDKAKFGDDLLKLHRIHWRLCNSCVFSSQASTKSQEQSAQQKQESVIVTQEDPFDPLTDKIPEKPVTFAEGASYSVIILAGLAVAAGAAYAVCKELIFEPKEYKIFGKTLERVQQDSQVKVRIGSPITGYGQESRNRAARQRIPHRMYTDEDGVERVEVNFYIRGPHGAGKVYSEMFKDKLDKTWKFTYLIVEITSPTKAKLMLESYVPA